MGVMRSGVVSVEKAGRTNGDPSRDVIARKIEDEILTGTLLPGDRLDERALALRFGVSRTPVREAIARLASLGLIEVKPRSGSFVAEVRLEELFQIFEVMAQLEGLCARYCAERMDTTEHDELRRLVDACSAQNSPDDYAITNAALHSIIYRSAKNEYLETLARQSRQRVASYRNYTFRLPGRIKRSTEEHIAIAEAICAGDAMRAQLLMTQHTDIKRDDFAPFIAMITRRERRS
jgi:DNA-binding GntR family transcriptional regulator